MKTTKERRQTREELLRGLVHTLGLPIQNLTLLDVALTHTSFANENKQATIHHNERLEFLGDAVLDLIVAEYLFLHYPQMAEGELTRAKAAIVCESSLAEMSRKLEYGKYLRLGRGEMHSGGRERPSILADTFEAVLGAIYLECSQEETEAFVLSHLQDALHRIEEGHFDEDYKTLLQEYVQRDGEHKIEYSLVEESGPDHNKSFVMAAIVDGVVKGQGTGKSKKMAEQEAAKVAYNAFRGK